MKGSNVKAVDKPGGERTASGRPSSLREMSEGSWREWDNHMIELKAYLRDNYPDLHTICPDPMRVGGLPTGYKTFPKEPLDKAALAACTNDEDGAEERKMIFAVHRETLVATNKRRIKQNKDKETVFHVIRSMCSVPLNTILGADVEYMGLKSEDPLELLRILRKLVTTKCNGHVEHDRTDAMTEWFNIQMLDNEDIASYSRRVAKGLDRIRNTGVEEYQIPRPDQQAFVFIRGLSNKVPMYAEYKNYLSDALETLKTDVYPKNLADAIHNSSRFHRGVKTEPNQGQSPAPHTSFITEEVRTAPPRTAPTGPTGAPTPPTTHHHSHRRFPGSCNYCGRTGHREAECRARMAGRERIARAAMATEAPYHSTFGAMYDTEEPPRHTYGITICATQPDVSHPVIGTTEAIFDTGATGSIIANPNVLNDIVQVPPTTFKGLAGQLEVTHMGTLPGIGKVYFDTRAGMSIISASECTKAGHTWDFNTDTFRLHTPEGTYMFHHRNGLYVGDLTKTTHHARTTVGPTSGHQMIYTAHIPTTSELEARYSTREVQRSAIARRFQAALGFPPDTKLMAALRAGTFLNSDVLPEDVKRATLMWGPSIPGIKGRTTREKPAPQPPMTNTIRSYSPQHMHCDVMFINKQAYLVTITHPVGLSQVACLENVSTPVLRRAVRIMFGNLRSRNIIVQRFTSDNERGLAAMQGDMAGMGVEAIMVGPGQHNHVIERMIRQLKETIRATIASIPFQVPDILMPHLVVSCNRKLMYFPSSTRTDKTSPFEVYYGRKANATLDIGPPFGTYCQVSNRHMTNGMEPRTTGCIYIEPRMNGTGTHTYMRLDNRAFIGANHMKILPFPPNVATYLNQWASKNKIHVNRDPTFIYHDRDITTAPDDEEEEEEEAPPLTQVTANTPHRQETNLDDTTRGVGGTIRGAGYGNRGEDHTPQVEETEDRHDVQCEDTTAQTDTDAYLPEETDAIDLSRPADVTDITDSSPVDAVIPSPSPPPARPPLELRQPSARIRKPVTRLNLHTTTGIVHAHMTVSRAMRLFPDKTMAAMEGEVKSLLGKQTFSGVHKGALTFTQRQRILRSNMNVVEKYLPTLDATGNRAIDKVKARLCVDGRGQDRADYLVTEIESPTANVASIFTVAQIAAKEGRYVMVGDVGTAYLNAKMPTADAEKRIHMSIDPTTAAIIMRMDPEFSKFRTNEGGLIVRLDKALYGCIESARLWNDEISGRLTSMGFVANPRDRCIFNKTDTGDQVTIIVYVDDLMMTSVNKNAVLKVEEELRRTYGQFRTTSGTTLTYLGCTWDYSKEGVVKIGQAGMIQDLVTSRERTHEERKGELKGSPHTPAALHIYEHTNDSPPLSEEHARMYHKDVATALFLGNRTRPDIVPALGELCKRVKAPTEEDDRKLDRMIAYLRSTRDVPLTLGCSIPPTVTVSIDAAYSNRDEKRSTTGMCITLGTGVFVTASKVQKTATKSSTEAEIVAVADGMNIPLWLRDFIEYQGYPRAPVSLEQDNMSCITLLQKGESTATATKYIDVKLFWVSDYIKRGEVRVTYVPTGEMTSDYFTKPLQGSLFTKMSNRIMGVV